MTDRQFNVEIVAALDYKAQVDLALIKLRQQVVDGEREYSASALLSAVELCDHAMQDVWKAIKPSILKTPR